MLFLQGLDSISEATMYNIGWDCTCENAWIVEYAMTNNITLVGDLMCDDGGMY